MIHYSSDSWPKRWLPCSVAHAWCSTALGNIVVVRAASASSIAVGGKALETILQHVPSAGTSHPSWHGAFRLRCIYCNPSSRKPFGDYIPSHIPRPKPHPEAQTCFRSATSVILGYLLSFGFNNFLNSVAVVANYFFHAFLL